MPKGLTHTKLSTLTHLHKQLRTLYAQEDAPVDDVAALREQIQEAFDPAGYYVSEYQGEIEVMPIGERPRKVTGVKPEKGKGGMG